MDHHCPWIGNCVGANNIKFFIQFLFYAFVSLVYCFLIEALVVLQWIINGKKDESFMTMSIYIQCSSCFALAIPVGFLLFTQLISASNNATTIEEHIPDIRSKNPFDLGDWRSNLREIFGDLTLKNLFLPITKANENTKERLIEKDSASA